MYSAIIKCFNTLVINIFLVLFVNDVVKSNFKFFSLHTLLWLLVSISPCLFVYTIGYNFLFTVLSFVFLTISLHRLFDISFTEGMMFTLYFMLMSIIPDLISSAVAINFFKYELINPLFTIFTNFFISVSTYYLFKIGYIKKFTKNSQKNVKELQDKNIITYVLLAALAIGISYYIIIEIYIPSRFYIATNVIIIIFVILTFIYIGKIIKYNKLKVKNSILYECMANIEDYQEEQDLKIHEYKNQLSKITAITSDKEVLSKIEEILDVDLTADTYLLGKIRSIPKGELKSLIYYKLLIASRENLNFFINIGSEINNEVYNFNKNQYKILSNLIGIFFDNAIEASKESKEKELYFEIYDSNIGLTFLISNTYKGKIDLSKIGTKGYTTKGGSHGKGLHLAKKMLNKNNNISTRTIINGNQFVQKIIIKRNELSPFLLML